MKKINYIKDDTRFERWTVLEFAYAKKGHKYYKCICTCGTEKIVNENNLKRGLTKSCGCLSREIASKTMCYVNKKYSYKRRKYNNITIEDNTAYIHLPDGSQAIIDADDVPRVEKKRWGINYGNAKYVRSTDKVYLHRFIMEFYDLSKVIDHIDGDPLNNKKSNLQICKQGINTHRRIYENKTGFRGVTKQTGQDRYVAYINFEGVRYHLGVFDRPEDAAKAYNSAAMKYYGHKAILNIVEGKFLRVRNAEE